MIRKLTTDALQLLICLSLTLASSASLAKQELTIIPTKHRPAEQMLSTLAPLVSAPDSISAVGNQIVLRASAKNTAQIAMLIEELDQPLKQFMIEVRQGVKSGTQLSSNQVRFKSGGPQFGSSQLNTLTIKRSTGTKGGHTAQNIRAIEGFPAYIQTGNEIPFWRFDEQGGIGREYKSLVTGFYATILASGAEHFTIQMSAQKQTPKKHSNEIANSRYQSTLSGRLGEWIPIGSSERDSNTEHRTITSSSSTSSKQTEPLSIKVTQISL